MSAEPLPIYVGPAYVGWRSWRILKWETPGQPASVRLCASGTHGLPKVWQPGRALEAVCGKFETTHDAPWFDCECGIHAYAIRDAAEAHLAEFAGGSNGDGVLGWAFGRVSLWGRIVEHEVGWRAQYAYPYELTVYGTEELAQAVRQVYMVDVDTLPPHELPQEEEEQSTAPPTLSSHYSRDPFSYTRDGRWRSDGEQRYLVTEVLRAGVALRARDLIEAIFAGLDAEDEPDIGDVTSLGHLLYKMALAGEVRRVRRAGGGSRVYWSHPERVLTDAHGFVESDPRQEHLDKDLVFVEALCEAGRGETATVKDVMAVLSEAAGEEQKSQCWSGTIARCQWRGWMEPGESRRSYKPTRLGGAVAAGA
jgi:hypothetical protein